MKQRTKKFISILSGSILIIALFAWYFFPVLYFKWFWYRFDLFHQYLSVIPIPILELKEPPEEWEKIVIGGLTMKLPISEYTKILGKETYIQFISDTGYLRVSVFVNRDGIPIIPFENQLKMYRSTPADISFFNSKKRNMEATKNQICKAIAIPNGGLRKLLTVNVGGLKAICILSEKRERGYGCITELYCQNKDVSITVIFGGYKDEASIEADLLSVLGGIELSDHMSDLNQVSRDIDFIVNKYSKT